MIWLQNPQQSKIIQLPNSGIDVIVNIMIFSHTTGAVGMQLWHSLSGSYTECYGRSLIFPYIYAEWVHPLHPLAAKDHADTSCLESVQPPAVRAHCGSQGKRGWAGGGSAPRKKKQPSSFAFYQKEQLFPVLGHRWYCAEERKRERGRSIKHRFFFSIQAVK